MCDQVVRPLLGRGAGGRSPGYRLKRTDAAGRAGIRGARTVSQLRQIHCAIFTQGPATNSQPCHVYASMLVTADKVSTWSEVSPRTGCLQSLKPIQPARAGAAFPRPPGRALSLNDIWSLVPNTNRALYRPSNAMSRGAGVARASAPRFFHLDRGKCKYSRGKFCNGRH
jgi:hypothetical protein